MARRVHHVNVGGVVRKKCKDFLGQSKEFRVSLGFYSFFGFSMGFLF